MEPTSLTGVFAGYELASGYRWSGIYVVWSFDEVIHTDLSVKESGLSRRQRKPHNIKAIELIDEGIVFPLKSEYDRINHSLDGIREQRDISALEILDTGVVIVHVVQPKDHWIMVSKHWMRVHVFCIVHVIVVLSWRRVDLT
ncbi:MAG: hypothetical protein ACKPKO_22975, partial [Candidatus Fonsibacter sp.]